MKTSDGAIVHLVGEQITFANVSRQRCLWCGALVDERNWSNMAIVIPEGMSESEAWDQERKTLWKDFVGVDGNMTYAVPHDDDKPPVGSCMFLDLEVTK